MIDSKSLEGIDLKAAKPIALTSFVCFYLEVETAEGKKLTFFKRKNEWWLVNEQQETTPAPELAEELKELWFEFVYSQTKEILVGDYNIKLYDSNKEVDT